VQYNGPEKNIHLCNFLEQASISQTVDFQYTGCIKMIGAVWKLIKFTSMMNRIINTSRNEKVTQKDYDTCLQIFDVYTLRHTAHIEAIVHFPAIL
jgi:hypothetical protein